MVDVFLSNYSSESGIANGESAQQDDIFDEPKSGAQVDTIWTETRCTVTSNGDCDECLLSTVYVARTINKSTVTTMHITVNHSKCDWNISSLRLGGLHSQQIEFNTRQDAAFLSAKV